MSQQDTEEVWRTDRENDRVIIGDETAVSLRGDGFERIEIDHASGQDGYVAFKATVEGQEESLSLVFEEVHDA